MGTVLKHTQTVLAVLSRVQVVVLETVHLAVTLRATRTDGTHIRARALLCLLESETVVNRIVDGKVTLTGNVSSTRSKRQQTYPFCRWYLRPLDCL